MLTNRPNVLLLSLALLACASQTVSKAPPTTATEPANPHASAAARALFARLRDLPTSASRGVVVGQNCGHGDQAADSADRLMSYAALVSKLHDDTGKWVGMVGLDYEHDKIFRPEQLSRGNAVLIEHWNQGGLVTVNWSPQNPWLNDESDLAGNQGVWTNTRNQGDNLANVKMDDLVDPASAIYPIWMRKLDRVAAALAELRNAGVIVLWRPLQEMNGNWFWWGYATRPGDGGPYRRLWQAMFRTFSEEKGLDNLLWVFSPADGGGKAPDFDYPGDAVVDFVSPTYYGDKLSPASYSACEAFGKPMGFAEFGITSRGANERDGTFDVRKHLEAIRTHYPRISYFVAWHDWDWGDGTTAHQSLVANQHAAELLADPMALTAPLDR